MVDVGGHKRELGVFSDGFFAILAFIGVVEWHLGGFPPGPGSWYVRLIPVILGTWWLLGLLIRHDLPYRLPSALVEIRETVAVNLGGLIVVICLSLLTKNYVISRLVVVVFPTLSAVLAILFRMAVRTALMAWRERGRDARHVLLVGPTQPAMRLADSLFQPGAGLRPVGLLVPPGSAAAEEQGLALLGDYAALSEVLHSRVVDQVAVAAPLDDPGLRPVVETALREGKAVWLHLDAFGAQLVGRGGQGQLIVVAPERSPAGLWMKRMLDIAVATICLVLTAPVLGAVALAIKLEDPRAPVIFRQKRVGLHGREFFCYKFRSMVPDAEKRRAELLKMNEMSGPVFKIKHDPRITRVGRFLRKFSLDELPQLWNVLTGDMSLVGPRPPLPDEVRQYAPDYRRRLAFRPGLTCLWQVSGRNNVDFDRWMQLDLNYVDNWSLWLDVVILLRTIPVVLFGSGM